MINDNTTKLHTTIRLGHHRRGILVTATKLCVKASTYSNSSGRALFATTATNGNSGFAGLTRTLTDNKTVSRSATCIRTMNSLRALNKLRCLNLRLPRSHCNTVLHCRASRSRTKHTASYKPHASELVIGILLRRMRHLTVPILADTAIVGLLRRHSRGNRSHITKTVLTANRHTRGP